MIEIDGSYGEGGGQILRTAVALSALTHRPCRVFNIRKGRPQPGLRHQHLEAAKAVQTLCNGEINGAEIGSTDLRFIPHPIRAGMVDVKIPTAGSIGLVLQAMMIPAFRAQDSVTIRFQGGATNGKFAPPLNYLRFVLMPLLQKMGYKANIVIDRYGYFPRGGARITATIHPAQLQPLDLTQRGALQTVSGTSHAALALKKSRVSERQAEAALAAFNKVGIRGDIDILYSDTICPGAAIELRAIFDNSVIGSDGLGEKGIRAEEVGEKAALALINQLSGPGAVDEYAEDQLLPYMALAPPSRIKAAKITGHAKTNIFVIEKFLPVKFAVHSDMISVKAQV
ncbi:MAG: RNA 3'-terminal phosphate cyclase [Acidobacteria bacterium]|nr:RNA 3'-terminal phosphate cyclase [Acidobacteriota bacterium]